MAKDIVVTGSGGVAAAAASLAGTGFAWQDVRGGLRRKGGGAWVEAPITDALGWRVACLLVRVGEGVTLAEMRILPDDLPLASGSPMQHDRRDSQPRDLRPQHAGGITSRMLRKVPLGAIFDEALRRLNESGGLPKDWDSIAPNAPSRPGRAGRDDHFYAVWASRYVEQVSTSRSPVRDLARQHGERYGAVAGWIFEARNRELLTRAEGAQQGKRGGTLTPKAMRLITNAKGGK